MENNYQESSKERFIETFFVNCLCFDYLDDFVLSWIGRARRKVREKRSTRHLNYNPAKRSKKC